MGIDIRCRKGILFRSGLRISDAIAGDVKPSGIHASQNGIPVSLKELRLYAQSLGNQVANVYLKTRQDVIFIMIGPRRPVSFHGNNNCSALPDLIQEILALRHRQASDSKQQACKE